MSKSVRLIAILLFALCARGSCAVGATLHAQLFPHTGEVRLRNKGTTPVSLVFYSISSAGSALNSSPSVWKSVDNFYDVSGDGFIDPNDLRATPENLDFNKTRERYLSSRIVEFERQDDLLVLTIEIPKREGVHGAWQERFWIDPAKGYTTTAVGDPRHKGATMQMEWMEVNGTWVIDSLRVGDRPELQFTWEDVNQEISPEEFKVQQIVPEGYQVSLYRMQPFTHDRIEMGILR
jgi:hypothetical protein